jgi:rhodanese-related sulfurtransferase
MFCLRRSSAQKVATMIATPTPSAQPEIASEISLDELRDALAGSAPPRVAEVLGPQYFAQGHLPSALNLPLEGFEAAARQALPDRDAPVVLYCASDTCRNSDIAARKLQSLGYGSVRVFKGGKAAWKAAGLALAL